MSNTRHHHHRAPCARYFAKESKEARKSTTRALRRANRATAHALAIEPSAYASTALPVHKGTQGWITH